MDEVYKRWFLLLGILGLFLIVFLLVGRARHEEEAGIDTNTPQAQNGEITVSGVGACLPYRDPKQPGECVLGIKGDDGKIYALDTIGVNTAGRKVQTGLPVTAFGIFYPADTSNAESSAFIYDGVLKVSSFQ